MALSTTCHKCGRPVSVRVTAPTPDRIAAATTSAVCTSCWLSRSIRNPHGSARVVGPVAPANDRSQRANRGIHHSHDPNALQREL
jgi:hypothetical protein